LLTNLADFGCFASRENSFHRLPPLDWPVPVARIWPGSVSPLRLARPTSSLICLKSGPPAARPRSQFSGFALSGKSWWVVFKPFQNQELSNKKERFADLATDRDYNYLADHVNANHTCQFALKPCLI
jgi:hypothetical protein